uniref:Ribosomal protein n=1 Tax=Astyanax mexicanus TaxID=7994 RepID=A0A3B1ID77_ASTMX
LFSKSSTSQEVSFSSWTGAERETCAQINKRDYNRPAYNKYQYLTLYRNRWWRHGTAVSSSSSQLPDPAAVSCCEVCGCQLLTCSECQRCISTVTAALAPARGIFSPVQGLRSPLCSPLVGQCQQLLCVQPSAGMKTKTALKKRCKDCFFVRRRGRLFVYCKTHPRHKQRQG